MLINAWSFLTLKQYRPKRGSIKAQRKKGKPRTKKERKTKAYGIRKGHLKRYGRLLIGLIFLPIKKLVASWHTENFIVQGPKSRPTWTPTPSRVLAINESISLWMDIKVVKSAQAWVSSNSKFEQGTHNVGLRKHAFRPGRRSLHHHVSTKG